MLVVYRARVMKEQRGLRSVPCVHNIFCKSLHRLCSVLRDTGVASRMLGYPNGVNAFPTRLVKNMEQRRQNGDMDQY
jgi:hypothetical protein